MGVSADGRVALAALISGWCREQGGAVSACYVGAAGHAATPVYVPVQPVYPAPVYAAPPAAYYAPPPVVVAPGYYPYGYWHRRHW